MEGRGRRKGDEEKRGSKGAREWGGMLSCNGLSFADRGKLAPSLVKPLVGNSTNSNKQPKQDVGVELAVPGHTNDPDPPDQLTKPKVPSRDAPIRWISFLIFLVVMVVFIAILIILVAID
jgi:hypothetical protein